MLPYIIGFILLLFLDVGVFASLLTLLTFAIGIPGIGILIACVSMTMSEIESQQKYNPVIFDEDDEDDEENCRPPRNIQKRKKHEIRRA